MSAARTVCSLALAALALHAAGALGDEPPRPRSGLAFTAPDIRALQEDDFANPGMLWVERGAALWREPAGAAGKSCADCHGGPEAGTAEAGARYPRFEPRLGTAINLEQRINFCRSAHMAAAPLAYESDDLLALSAHVRHQSRGRPVVADEQAAMTAVVARGQAFFEQRRGAFDLACVHCHERSVGKSLREERISQGQSNGFPAYRLSRQGMVSLHRRFQACNTAVGAEPLPLGADDYVALEAYLAVRGRGLPVETPAVRR